MPSHSRSRNATGAGGSIRALRVSGSQLPGSNRVPLPGRQVAKKLAGVPFVSHVIQVPSAATE